MRAPQVSVVIPTHNRSAMLQLTLRTELWQQQVELEAIVVDDGSTDDTATAVARLADRRVRLVRHDTPQGVSVARNRGIHEARGDWIAFLDDDDLWAPHKLASQLEAAGSGTTWVYAGAVKIDGRQRIIGGQPPPPPEKVMRRLPNWSLVPGGCSGVIAARDALATTGGFDPRLVNLADWDLWIRLGRTGPPAYDPRPQVGYRFHGGQASLDVGLILKEAGLLDRRYGPPIDRGALHHYLAHRCLVASRPRQAIKHLAIAALHGEVKPVVSDASGMALRRLGGRLRVRRRPDSHAEWRAQAKGWLATLDEQVAAPVTPQPAP
jgi:glycosyltransferase involved in cell wall biosynthesis